MRPVFLHSEWRTGSTYVWAKLGRAPGSTGFLEPFHEVLATIDQPAIERLVWDSWPSGHAGLDAPYFAEYAELLQPAGGIRGFQPRFTFDDYFDLSPEAVAPQVGYLQGLIDLATGRGRRPVLGFCRSIGRLPWLAAAFSDAAHVELRRDPVSQWVSGWRQATRHGNPYFVSCYVALVGLARHPYFEQLRGELGIPVPRDREPDAAVTFYNEWAMQGSAEELFRVFWHVHAFNRDRAKGLCELVIDVDQLSNSATYRRGIEGELRQRGFDVSFDDASMPGHRASDELGDLAAQEALAEAHLAAWVRNGGIR